MSDDTEWETLLNQLDSGDITELAATAEFVAKRADHEYWIGLNMTGEHMMQFIEAFTRTTQGDKDATMSMYYFLQRLVGVIYQVLQMDPDEVHTIEDDD